MIATFDSSGLCSSLGKTAAYPQQPKINVTRWTNSLPLPWWALPAVAAEGEWFPVHLRASLHLHDRVHVGILLRITRSKNQVLKTWTTNWREKGHVRGVEMTAPLNLWGSHQGDNKRWGFSNSGFWPLWKKVLELFLRWPTHTLVSRLQNQTFSSQANKSLGLFKAEQIQLCSKRTLAPDPAALTQSLLYGS